mgnify:CR=1 FL=1
MYVQLDKVLLEVKQADDQGKLAGQPMVLWVWQTMHKMGCNVMFGVGGCIVMNIKRTTYYSMILECDSVCRAVCYRCNNVVLNRVPQ